MPTEPLKSRTNTPENDTDVQTLFSGLAPHTNLSTVFEHGNWWITCNDCGAVWAVHDAEGAGIDPAIGLEAWMSCSGDGFCE